MLVLTNITSGISRPTLNAALCVGRHEMPEHVNTALFGSICNPTNTGLLDTMAQHNLYEACASADLLDMYGNVPSNLHVNLYVTGLTVALIAAINAIKTTCPEGQVTLYHFNRDTGDYFPQEVL